MFWNDCYFNSFKILSFKTWKFNFHKSLHCSVFLFFSAFRSLTKICLFCFVINWIILHLSYLANAKNNVECYKLYTFCLRIFVLQHAFYLCAKNWFFSLRKQNITIHMIQVGAGDFLTWHTYQNLRSKQNFDQGWGQSYFDWTKNFLAFSSCYFREFF